MKDLHPKIWALGIQTEHLREKYKFVAKQFDEEGTSEAKDNAALCREQVARLYEILYQLDMVIE